MKGRVLFALLALAVLCGCESYFNRSFVTADKHPGANEVGLPTPHVDKYARQGGASNQEAADRLKQDAIRGSSLPGEAVPSLNGKPDLAALPVGGFCRLDLTRPPGKGQAYQGKIVRVEKDAIVLSNVISEGPMKRSRSPALRDLLTMRMPWSGGQESIDWKALPDKELRIARSEVAAARVLDHDPIVDYYQR